MAASFKAYFRWLRSPYDFPSLFKNVEKNTKRFKQMNYLMAFHSLERIPNKSCWNIIILCHPTVFALASACNGHGARSGQAARFTEHILTAALPAWFVPFSAMTTCWQGALLPTSEQMVSGSLP